MSVIEGASISFQAIELISPLISQLCSLGEALNPLMVNPIGQSGSISNFIWFNLEEMIATSRLSVADEFYDDGDEFWSKGINGAFSRR